MRSLFCRSSNFRLSRPSIRSFDHLAQFAILLFPILLPILLPLFPLFGVELERLAVKLKNARSDKQPVSIEHPDARALPVNQFEVAMAVNVVKAADGVLANRRVGVALGYLNQFINRLAALVVSQRADDVLLHLLILQTVVNLDQGVRAFVAFDIAEVTDGAVAQFLVLFRLGDRGQLGDGLAVVYFAVRPSRRSR